MRATELVGKIATRTARTKECNDGSWMSEPLLINYADESHIHITFMDGFHKGDYHLLDKDFCDDSWRDWDALQEEIDKGLYKIQQQLEMGRIFVK